MSSGFQEILLIVAILLAILFIPRMTGPKRRVEPTPFRPFRRLLKIGVRWRVALVVTLLWLMGTAVYFRLWQGGVMEQYLLVGVGPVLIGWCITWVVAGIGMRGRN